MKKYDHKKIEKKWQKYWNDNKTFVVENTGTASDQNMYILDMFPYPSGAGLHVGHPEGYTATDILSRYYRMNGRNVLHPMGWDAFGLPAENYAIKEGVHPDTTTKKNINRFREQIQSIGLSYDWTREISTADPEYYKWTQWLFLLMYKNGLAYKKEASVNWCPKDNTVLANEQASGGVCDRCGTKVIQKLLSQWFLKISDYTERLLQDLEGLDWPHPIVTMQKNWIGKKTGINITYQVADRDVAITCFTTRPDTNFGATFIVIGPEHPLLVSDNPLNIDTSYWEEVQAYQQAVAGRTELERMAETKKKSGVFIGLYCINPLNDVRMPIYVADYVLGNVGTGAVIGVPGHDVRDFEFAQVFGLPVVRVVQKDENDTAPIVDVIQVQEADGTMVNSGFLDGMNIHHATDRMMDHMEQEGWGKRVVNYRLRDWLISRQRYWGAPIPIVYCDTCGEQPVPDKDLPVILPMDVDFTPTGEPPLARSKEFHEGVTCPKCDGPAKRDSDTMDTFVDSSWYFLRFTDPKNTEAFADTKYLEEWLPVDTYVGGAEHAVLHLLYARFFTKVLYDLKYVNFQEPFLKLRNQGLIMGPDGEKMSKSKGNVINPDDVVAEHGADTLRMYEMFMGPLEDAKPWSTQGMVGVRRFLDRVWIWGNEIITKNKDATVETSKQSDQLLHKLIKKITDDIQSLSLNTAISSFMSFHNEVKDSAFSVADLKTFLLLLYPFAPHITEELYEMAGGTVSLQLESWPTYDPKKIEETSVDLIIQVNGKVRDKVRVAMNLSEDEAKAQAMGLEKIKTAIAGSPVQRVIYVPNRLLNIVV